MSSSTRPTLPSIRSLGLLSMTEAPVQQWTNDNKSMTINYAQHTKMTRRHSIASSIDSDLESSRSTSPSSPLSSTPSPTSPSSLKAPSAFSVPDMIASGARVRFTPCQLTEADAVMLFPPSTSPSTPPSKPVMLFAPAIDQIRRHPERLLSKGARMHPYRMRAVLPSRDQRRPRSHTIGM